ncbi:hypothetical protein [Butyrivibrio sp. XPD2002]|uniref:hypothetical protein n=1 Tax=Butyrivibrio sp. XPD2002 TaxID=1280665 RepID=UPI0003F547E2|nr:hypothetical protein [Butyrivibrio sp. XPD2002]
MDTRVKVSTKGNMVEWFLPFFPLFLQYKLGVLSLGVLGLTVIAFIYLSKQGIRLSFPRRLYGFVTFFIYVIVRDVVRIIVGMDSRTTQIHRMIEYIIMIFLMLIISYVRIDSDNLYQWYKIAGALYILGAVYHAVLIYLFHRTVTWITIIPGYILREDTKNFGRPLSFFSEPAGIVLGLIFLLIFSLQRKDYIWAIITSVGMFISTSSVAVIITLAMWTLLVMDKEMSQRKKATIIVLFIGLIILFFNLNAFSESASKFMTVVGGGSTVGSRLRCGYEVVSTMSPMELIFGTNYNEVMKYITDRMELFPQEGTALLYYNVAGDVFLNTWTNLIFKYGMIGMVLSYLPIIALAKNVESKYISICFILLSIGQSLLLNPAFFLYLTMMLITSNIGKDNKNKIAWKGGNEFFEENRDYHISSLL